MPIGVDLNRARHRQQGALRQGRHGSLALATSLLSVKQGNRVIEVLAEAMAEARGGMFPTNWNLGLARPGGGTIRSSRAFVERLLR